MLEHYHYDEHLVPIVVLLWCAAPILLPLVQAFLLIDELHIDSDPPIILLNCIRWFPLKWLLLVA